ncbi:MAG: HAD hydrolase family protein [Bacteroides sp.]|nr:HAD hydrolase family protein [Eubacterium sp.]MCM1417976.1 HAD hydrolase family protein [Roseburia sp.]MCM1461777.1 HAD hydrolase family protein [Bacteroides sp.]
MSGRLDFSPSLIVYDFDGVMTDNTALIDERGNEAVFVHRGDGYGVRMIRDRLKIPQIILSTEENPVVARRAEKLKIPVVHNAGDGKAEILKVYAREQGYRMDRIMYIGNDLNDYDAMTLCGFRCCPADAEKEIRAIADHIFDSPGGRGVIRELYRILSEAENE